MASWPSRKGGPRKSSVVSLLLLLTLQLASCFVPPAPPAAATSSYRTRRRIRRWASGKDEIAEIEARLAELKAAKAATEAGEAPPTAPGSLFGLVSGLFGGGGREGGGGEKKKKEDITDAEAREKYGIQLPKYDAIQREGYELRRYQAMSVVECDYEARPQGYELLGGYTGKGENALGFPMPQTAPAVMSPCLSPKTMFYVLPSPHTPLDPAESIVPPPAPLDDGLRTKTVEALAVAVVKFSGYATPDVVFKKRDECKALLQRDGTPYDAATADPRLMIAQYNELFSLPWNRDNEVWLPIAEWPDEEK